MKLIRMAEQAVIHLTKSLLRLYSKCCLHSWQM